MSDPGFIYDFLNGVSSQVVDISGKQIRVDLAFSANDEAPASGLIVGKELFPTADPSLPLGVADSTNSNSLVNLMLLGLGFPAALGSLPSALQGPIWTTMLNSLPGVLLQALAGEFGSDNFTFTFTAPSLPQVRARAITDATVGNWLLLDLWISPLTVNINFGAVYGFPWTPEAPQLADAASSGGLAPGKYLYAITALDGFPDQNGVQGETAISDVVAFQADGHDAALTWQSVNSPVGGYNIYRSRVGAPDTVLYLVGSAPTSGWNPNLPPQPGSFLDTTPDSGLSTNIVVSTSPPWMPTMVYPNDPNLEHNYLLWPSSPFTDAPTVNDSGPGGGLSKGTYRYAVTALSGRRSEETVASPVSVVALPSSGRSVKLSWQAIIAADGGYNIYRSLANDGGNAIYMVGHVAQPPFEFNVNAPSGPLPTVVFTDSTPDGKLNQKIVPPTGSVLPAGWSPPSVGPLQSGTLKASADLEFGMTMHLNSWPNAVVSTWSTVLNTSITPTGGTSISVALGEAVSGLLRFLVSVGNFFTGGNFVPSGESPGQALQNAQSQVAGLSIGANPFSLFTSELASMQSAAAKFGFLQCTASTDIHSQTPLGLLLIHPDDPPPVAFDLATMVGPGQPMFSQYDMHTDRGQATPGSSLNVVGSGFPSFGLMGIGWTDTCSGFVTGSDVKWGPEGESPSTIHLSGANFQFQPFAPPARFPIHRPGPQPTPGPYVFRVRNSDDDPSNPLTTTGFSDPVTVYSVGQVDLVLQYVSSGTTVPKPPGGKPQLPRGVVVGTPQVAPNGTFSASIFVPADALPGQATLSAQITGQIVFSVTFQIVDKIAPLIRLVNTATLATISTDIYAGYSADVAGEGFHPSALVRLFLDSESTPRLTQGPADAQGSFRLPVKWRPAIPGAHTLLAVQVVGAQATTASLALNMEELG